MAASADGDGTWGRVLEEADGLAAELRDEGWETCLVRAGHLAAVPPDADADRHGLVYIVPDSVGKTLPPLVADGSFERYEVFRTVTPEKLFVVTRLRDADQRAAIVLAGAMDRKRVRSLAAAAHERGEVHSHVRLLDGTYLATFHHADPSHFFPEAT